MNNIKNYFASYNDSDDEDVDDDQQNVHDDIHISDDEQDKLFHGKRKKSVSPIIDNNLNEEEQPQKVQRVTATRLVSYGEDEDANEKSLNRSSVSEQDEEQEEKSNPQEEDNVLLNLFNQGGETDSPSLSNGGSPQINRDKPYCAKHIQLPPEPVGNCSKRLQNKVVELYNKVTKENMNLNVSIQRKKNFRNPSIYERLIEFCGIDEKGTNYPPELYNPTIWGPESFYEELAKTQKIEMDKKEKEKEKKDKKPIVEKVQTTKKPNSKWDDASAPPLQIPAVGTLTKSK